jgi:hypothetical protein
VPSALEQSLLARSSSLLPIIPLPPLSHFASSPALSLRLSRFQPSTALALRAGLFRSPETLSSLRSEATSFFLDWREARANTSASAYESTSLSITMMPAGGRARRSTISNSNKSNNSNVSNNFNTVTGSGSGIRPANRPDATRRQTFVHRSRPSLAGMRTNTIRSSSSGSGLGLGSQLGSDSGAGTGLGISSSGGWDKAAWEAEWAATHPVPASASPSRSQSRMRNSRRERDQDHAGKERKVWESCESAPSAIDPLHLPSLFRMGVALLGPMRERVRRAFGLSSGAGMGSGSAFGPAWTATGPRRESDQDSGRSAGGEGGYARHRKWRIGVAVLGAFCVGIGVGLVARARGAV